MRLNKEWASVELSRTSYISLPVLLLAPFSIAAPIVAAWNARALKPPRNASSCDTGLVAYCVRFRLAALRESRNPRSASQEKGFLFRGDVVREIAQFEWFTRTNKKYTLGQRAQPVSLLFSNGRSRSRCCFPRCLVVQPRLLACERRARARTGIQRASLFVFLVILKCLLLFDAACRRFLCGASKLCGVADNARPTVALLTKF